MGRGALRSERLAMLAEGRAVDAMGQRETNLAIQELLDVGADDFGGRDRSHLDDLDAAETSAVTGGQIHIELVDSADSRGVSELLVNVVSSRPAVVSAQDSKIFGSARLPLEHLSHAEDLTGGGLELFDARKKIPEAALCVDGGRGEDLHLIDLGPLVVRGGLCAANDVEFVEHHLS